MKRPLPCLFFALLLLLAACDRGTPGEAASEPSGASPAPPSAETTPGAPAAAEHAPAASAAAAEPAPIECTTAADAFPGEPGTRVTVRCPAGCTAGAVWGTHLYSDDSAICTAAIHAGVLDPQEAGTVAFFVATGATHYPPSTRHGITTREWPEWPRSFAFPAAHPVERTVRATCATRAQHLPGPTHTVQCPAGCTEGQLWGTNLYTDDSMICTAAIHAGLLLADEAGTVQLTIAPGEASYTPSERHGIRSTAWPEWGRSFRLAAR